MPVPLLHARKRPPRTDKGWLLSFGFFCAYTGFRARGWGSLVGLGEPTVLDACSRTLNAPSRIRSRWGGPTFFLHVLQTFYLGVNVLIDIFLRWDSRIPSFRRGYPLTLGLIARSGASHGVSFWQSSWGRDLHCAMAFSTKKIELVAYGALVFQAVSQHGCLHQSHAAKLENY